MKIGIQLAVMTMFISGFSIFASKFFVSGMDPILFTTLKNLIVAVVLSVVVFYSQKKALSNLSKSQWKKLIIIGIVGGSIPFALFFTGLSKISALEGALIHKTLFIWVAIMSVFFLKEKVNRYQIFGYLLVTSGVLFFGGVSYKSLGVGHLMIVAATLFWSVEYIIAKKVLKDVSSTVVSWARMSFGVIILLGLSIYQGSLSQIFTLGSSQILAVVSGAVFLLGYVLTWYSALSQSNASTVSLVLAASPIVTGILSAVFITHAFPQAQVFGWMIIIAGVVMSLLFSRPKQELAV
ncbi:hypothetical protein CO051_04790 [Candidatus Roizmanbacteria bacterium CG_4_9_14_0_2_um_filter_39_13]|uniref:EamA domain-containing protein n=1 Tax=Candidatus Roizmanbacteria bacterium CG_4_9_14_0_2_um_filter_39_13 TaxID=1974839 RepID=A0A2M8EXQ3_9BACT|nr:MAG: hypothetical protein COY15_05020 [Candidatus Roizmanbacteria bacterium CG_4_10_14_0_2_um_filter_39_12]PJC30930.1 MAG: hypothetical protein CO051_04790 [Candidatus Roizmanbacteria bacterium CG_4_9_14_0_2_um_filter_39_13]